MVSSSLYFTSHLMDGPLTLCCCFFSCGAGVSGSTKDEQHEVIPHDSVVPGKRGVGQLSPLHGRNSPLVHVPASRSHAMQREIWSQHG